MLSDELWLKIHGAFNLLCGTCIIELVELWEEFDYFDLVKLDAMNLESFEAEQKK